MPLYLFNIDLQLLEVCVLSNNHIIGPLPSSVASLNRMKDFHVFSNWPSQYLSIPRAYAERRFDRLHIFAPHLKFNCLSWDDSLNNPDFPEFVAQPNANLLDNKAT